MSFFTLMTAGLAAFAPLVSAYTQPQGSGPTGNAFSAPGSGTTVQAGKDYTVKWDPSTVGSVTLLLLKGQNGQSLSVVYPIAEEIDNTGTYTWHVASDLTAGPTSTTGYGIQLIVDQNGQYQYTTPFGVAPASNSTSDSTPTPRVGPPVAATRAVSSSAAATSDGASIQTYGADSSSSDVVVASVYADATSTGIVLVTPTAAATTTLATSASVRASTTSRAASGTTSAAAATNTGAASSVKTSFMGLAAAAGLAILALASGSASAGLHFEMSGTDTRSKTAVPLWIDGKEVDGATTFDVVSPNDSKKLWTSTSVSREQAKQAIEAAQRAFKTWRRQKPAAIRKILLKAADIFEARTEELAGYMRDETGANAGHVDLNTRTAPEMLRDAAGRISGMYGIIPQSELPGCEAFILKEPYGVNFGIVPWNAPYILGTRAFVYAIATGNTVVLKGSELCPKTFWAMGSVLHEAGLPAGVLNVVYHRPEDAAEITNLIIEHPYIRKVNFTGSTAVGSIIASKAGKELKPVVMELGGKASAIVCADAELKNAAMQVALGAFLHSGQICMSTERILVHESVIEDFGRQLKAAVDKVFPSKETAPTLVATAGVEKNAKLMKDAVSKGAKVLYGDLDSKDDSAYRMRPIVISDVKKDMDIYYTESFGPTVSLISVSSDEEAIDIANDTEYGLSGAVFTNSLARGLRIAKEIDSGAVHINSMTVHDEAMLPHGGVKKSGWGRFNAQWGMEEFVKTKTITYVPGDAHA